MTKLEYQKLRKEMVTCRRCLDAGYEISPGAIFSGPVTANIMLIGQAPGITEVSAKRPFNAGSGTRLFQWLAGAGFEEESFRKKQYMTAVTKCYPGKSQSGKGDRVPSRVEQQLCRSYLNQELQLVNPKVILPVGSLAIQLFIKKPWKLADIVGKVALWPADRQKLKVPVKRPGLSLSSAPPTNCGDQVPLIIPLPHPSGASLWPNKIENKLLIERAVELLDEISTKLGIGRNKKTGYQD